MQTWSTTEDYHVRIRNLMTPSADGYCLQRGTTVVGDTDADVLTGSADDDWFFLDDDRDRATDLVDEVLGGDLEWVRAG
jgi:hypothetical protein